jgi:predicted transcriptional regulator
VGEAKLIVDVTAPIGVTGKMIDVKKENTEFNEKNTIQRTGWIAYKFIDVQKGEKIVIEFEVLSKSGIENMGIRVFVIPEKNFKVYQENKPINKVISREYEKYWSGSVGETKSSGKIEIEPNEEETLIVVFDNRFYEEGKIHLELDEPAEYSVTAKRELTPAYWIENWLIPILGVVALVICILIIVYFYTKIRRDTLLENKIRAKILNYILKNPGVHYRKILTDLNLKMGVLTHHLNMLEQQEFLKSHNDHMYRRYYPPNIRINPAATLSPPQANVLQAIRSSPGISQVGIARNLNQDRKVVHYHVKRLSDEGLVNVVPNGRESKCYFVGNQSHSV